MTVKANRIFYDDALHHHLPTIGNDTDVTKSTIGVDPYDVIKLAIADTKFELIPDSELKEMGMTRIGADGVKIDFYPTDKINTYDVIQNVIEAYGRGEIYYDNYRFAVVERIGKDNGVRMSIIEEYDKSFSREKHARVDDKTVYVRQGRFDDFICKRRQAVH